MATCTCLIDAFGKRDDPACPECHSVDERSTKESVVGHYDQEGRLLKVEIPPALKEEAQIFRWRMTVGSEKFYWSTEDSKWIKDETWNGA